MKRVTVASIATVLPVLSIAFVVAGDPGLECGRSGKRQGIDCLESFPSSVHFANQPAQSLGWEVLFGAVALSTVALLYLLVSGALRVRATRRSVTG